MTTEFTEVYDTRTGLKQRVPTAWLDDPILGRFIKKTPSQRAFDGELGQAPTEDSTLKEIKAFADDAEIDVTGLRSKDELLGAVRAVVGTDPLPEPATPGVDVAPGSGATPDIDTPVGDTPSTDDTPPSDETPATGDEEN